MKNKIDIENRKPIWIAVSELYLDTELGKNDFKHIAIIIKESPYTFKEVKEIDKNEVFPILQYNLLSVAGEWAGFDDKWLIDEIEKSINKRNFIKQQFLKLFYFMFKSMNEENWFAIENEYNQLNNA